MTEDEVVDYDEDLKQSRKGRGFDNRGRPTNTDRGGTYDRGSGETKGGALKCKCLLAYFLFLHDICTVTAMRFFVPNIHTYSRRGLDSLHKKYT